MRVSCPRCARHYQLSEALLGGGGARVHCPQCGQVFTVSRPEVRLQGAAAGPSSPEEIADRVLSELAVRAGAGIERAVAEGRLFSEFGPALLEAWEEYLRRAGASSGAAAFRSALRRRWNVELTPALERAR